MTHSVAMCLSNEKPGNRRVFSIAFDFEGSGGFILVAVMSGRLALCDSLREL